MSNNNNPKPILIIEVPTYLGELLAISEGAATVADLIGGTSKIKDWHIVVIQTQKPEFDYRVFYPSGNTTIGATCDRLTVEQIVHDLEDCAHKPASPAADASIDELSKNAWAEYFSFEKEDQSFTVREVFCNENPESGGISRAFVMVPKSQPVPKVAKTQQEAFDVEEKFDGVPHGLIQWKGTEVCMDVHCKCGESFHIDGTFAYNVKCPECETIYAVNGHVELIELLDTSVNVLTGE